MLKGFELLKPAHIGGGGIERCLPLGVAARPLIGFLLSDGIHLSERLPAFGGTLREIQLRFRLVAGRAGLHEFLINLRSLDVGQQLTFLHAAAHIFTPAREIAVCTRVDRRLGIGLQSRWKDQFLLRRFWLRLDHDYARYREDFRFLRKSTALPQASNKCNRGASSQEDRDDHDCAVAWLIRRPWGQARSLHFRLWCWHRFISHNRASQENRINVLPAMSIKKVSHAGRERY